MQYCVRVFVPHCKECTMRRARFNPPASRAAVRKVATSSPWDWIWLAPWPRSRRSQKSSADRNGPCTSYRNHDADSQATRTWSYRRVLYQYTSTADVPIDCGCYSVRPSYRGYFSFIGNSKDRVSLRFSHALIPFF